MCCRNYCKTCQKNFRMCKNQKYASPAVISYTTMVVTKWLSTSCLTIMVSHIHSLNWTTGLEHYWMDIRTFNWQKKLGCQIGECTNTGLDYWTGIFWIFCHKVALFYWKEISYLALSPTCTYVSTYCSQIDKCCITISYMSTSVIISSLLRYCLSTTTACLTYIILCIRTSYPQL